jgi:hypothetical protein
MSSPATADLPRRVSPAPERGAILVVEGPPSGREEEPMSEEREKRSFWDRLFSIEYHSAREERVIEYIIHRLGEGAGLQEILGEEYVRRNASPAEVDEICSNPRLVEAARERMEQDFGSEELDPSHRPH